MQSKHSQAVITDVLLLTVVVSPFSQQLHTVGFYTHGNIAVLILLPHLTVILLDTAFDVWFHHNIYTCIVHVHAVSTGKIAQNFTIPLQ